MALFKKNKSLYILSIFVQDIPVCMLFIFPEIPGETPGQKKMYKKILIFLFLFKKTTLACQQITIPMCKSIGYNYTNMPNPFNHDTQEEAGLEVHQYWPLVEIKCSSDLRFFICSLYVPICMEDYKGSVPVCRSVCLRAKAGCEPVMTQYGFQWPEKMNCEKFPPYGVKNTICMDEKKGALPTVTIATNKTIETNVAIGDDTKKSCNAPLVKTSSNVTVFGIKNCALPCHFYGNEEEKKFANWWLTLWSGLCFFTSFVTMVTFFIDTGRFKYPERPIVYLSFCYLVISFGYLFRVWKGHEAVACFHGDIILQQHELLNNMNCTLVFILIYYFWMASSTWWVTLSLTWYLAAGCKWGSEAIASKSHVFHFVAWTLPALLTSFLLFFDQEAIDGDAVIGICSVGNQNTSKLIKYTIAPLAILLVIGTWFLLAGFIALFRIRQVIATQAGGRTKTEKLEKLMIRIGVFSVLYTLPASAVIAAYFYEIQSKQTFFNAVIHCNSKLCNLNKQQQIVIIDHLKPLHSVLMIKYFMSLAVGITTGVWIWSGKTIETWKLFLKKLIPCCKNNSSNKMQSV